MDDLIYKLDKTKEDVEALLRQNKNIVYFKLGEMHLLDNQDAESAAFEALWDAVNCFDVFCTVPFVNYACKCIENAVNDTIRKRKAKKRNTYVSVELTDNVSVYVMPDVDAENMFTKVQKLLRLYLDNNISGKLAREVLLVWYSSNFEMSATHIAKRCNTTASYVCRVQCAFRAYIGNKLVE